jgi:pimeloyl-ACP methyl ester carboxylesterase
MTYRRHFLPATAGTGARIRERAGLAVFLCGLAAAPANATDSSCPPHLSSRLPATCASLDVPASRRDRAQQTVSVGYVRIPATSTPAAEPLVILAGGPGTAGSELLTGLWPALEPLRSTRELIVVDQRGTGLSRPRLTCPGLPPAAVFQYRLDADQVRQCKAPLSAAGLQTGWFNTEESAHDLRDLRQALGIPQWSLLATGYGTVLAMETARVDPEGVRRMVLNSPTTAAASALDTPRLAAVAAVWERIFVDCAADPDCRWAYPSLRKQFLSISERLRTEPLPFRNPLGDPEQLSSAALQTIMTVLAGSGRGAALAPAVYDYLWRVIRGRIAPDNDKLAALYLPPGSATALENDAAGLGLSILCREVWPLLDVDALVAAGSVFADYLDVQRVADQFRLACPIWDPGKASDELHRAAQLPQPTLLLTGDYDTRTPSYRAVQLSARLPRARLLSFRGLGHDPFGSDACARKAVYRFLDAAEPRLHLECVQRQASPRFRVFDYGR